MAMMDKREFLDLCGAYALGALDDIDAIRFRAAIPHADAEMRAALQDARRAAARLSLAAPEAAPSPAVKARLMARVAESSRAPARAAKPERARADGESRFGRLLAAWLTPRPGFAMAFSLIVVCAGLAAYTVTLRDSLSDRRAEIAARDDMIAHLVDSLASDGKLRTTLIAMQDTLARKQALLGMLRCPAMREVTLASAATDSGAVAVRPGKVMWDADHGFAVLQVALPREAEDKDYQLWMIRGGKPVSAGVFHVAVDPDSVGALYRLDDLSPTEARNQDTFAITLEPKGGMPKPTGAMVLSGGLQI
jgi:anti-sigma-K factor RskA